VSEGHSHVPVEKGKLIARARRIEGQASGVVRMLADERGCQEVLQQIVALTSAAEELSIALMRDHMLARWQEGAQEGETLADELTGLVRRVVRR
jgi:DNA-binding FrmR family transcriptional regulator